MISAAHADCPILHHPPRILPGDVLLCPGNLRPSICDQELYPPSVREWEPVPRPLPPKHPPIAIFIGPPNALASGVIITIPLTSHYKYKDLVEGRRLLKNWREKDRERGREKPKLTQRNRRVLDQS